jgi:hypothetical protein
MFVQFEALEMTQSLLVLHRFGVGTAIQQDRLDATS